MFRSTVLKLLLCAGFFLFIGSIQAQSVGGFTSGSATYCQANNSGFISLNGYNGTILHWESSEDLVLWTNIPNPTATESYLNLLNTTHYRAIVQDGANPPDTSTVSTVTIFVPADGGIINGAGTFCDNSGAGTLTLTGETGNVQYWQFSIDNGATWTNVANTTTTLNYASITQNTIYEAVVLNEPSCPEDTSAQAVFIIDPLSDAGTLTPGDTICSDVTSGTILHTNGTGTVLDWIYSEDDGATWVSLGAVAAAYSFPSLSTTTWFAVIVQSGVCPADTTTPAVYTVVQPNPVDAGPDQVVVNHSSTNMNATGVGSAVWSPSAGLDDPNTLNPIATPAQTTTYYLVLTNATGCISMDSMTITVEFPMPSAFTPNGDGVNDIFFLDKLVELPGNKLTIYNRQGNVVYDRSPYNNEWNGVNNSGVDLPDGIYYYVFEFGNDADPINGFVLIKR